MSTSLQIAREISDALRSSIAELEKSNHHDEQLLRYLNHVLSYNNEPIPPSPTRPTDEKINHGSAPKQWNGATAVDDQQELSPLVASLPSKLDEILSLARTTREKKSNKVDKSKDNGKTSKLSSTTNQVKEQSMGRGDVNKKGGQQPQRPQQTTETVEKQRPTTSLRQHLNSQFLVLKRLRKYSRGLMSSRLLDESQVHHHQQQFLSLVNGRPTLPRSHLFTALSSSITTPSSTDHIPAPALDHADQSRRLVDMIQKTKEQYVRTFKGKLGGSNGVIPKLSPEDIESVLSIWYKLHRCIEARRNDNIKNGNTSVPANIVEDRSGGIGVDDLVDSIRIMTKPLPILPKNDTTILSREWLRSEMDRIEKENCSLDNSISVLMETTIGRYELKDTLKALRRCCETGGKTTFKGDQEHSRSVNDNNSKAEIHDNDPWVVSLKQYRAVYRCLSSSSAGANQLNQSCFFLPTST